ncbi:oxidoreductase [Konateibacter massiliensis]|uniref:oxidoreductase n=1 Tax=Konateibacter massiliensis TaxID=2002841 RepID=UPI000C1511B0|nr:FAD-dependent oxidoreductase [Konateibacter massiliensis]
MFDSLFSPIKINSMMVKNRIVAAPVGDTFEEKALGGAGIVIAGHTIVEPYRSSFKSADERSVFGKYEYEDTRRKILKIQQAGAKASIEIFHAGREARCYEYAKGPSAYIREDGMEVKEMDEAMMQETLDCYYSTAKEAKELGFDSIFMHFGHGWLPAQFLSPYFNKRTDSYGGSLENRTKFPLRILETVRNAVGPKFPIDMRISAYEWVEGSIEFEDVVQFIQMAEKYIDFVQISAGLDMNREANVHMATTNFEELMPNVKWAKEVKKRVNIPVSVVGAVLSPEEADDLIRKGIVDMVAFGRSFIADPDWPKKALSGHPEDIHPCIRCLQCYHIATNHKNVGCSVNPRYNNEEFVEKEVRPAKVRKNIVVIGGGPAGINAAVTASKAGHKVTLLEKSSELGGQLKYVAMEHFKEEIVRLMHHYEAQIAKSNVDIRLNFEATPENIIQFQPDSLIIAVGADEVIPNIPGIHEAKPMTGTQAIEKEDELGENIVILGGGTIGSEIGLELALIHHKKVTIIEMNHEVAAQGNELYKIALNQKIKQAKTLDILLETKCEGIENSQCIVKMKDGTKKAISFDNLIVCTGLRPKQELAESFFGIVPYTAMIGDCNRIGKIIDTTFEGFTVVQNLF